MNDYAKMVDKLIGRILESNDLNSPDDRYRDLIDKFRDAFGGSQDGDGPFGQVNFYPSDHLGPCCNIAFFISLRGKRWKIKNKDRVDFSELFDNIIQHCQGSCQGHTNQAIIITDNWDDDVANKWKHNIQALKSHGVEFHVFVITGSYRCYGSL